MLDSFALVIGARFEIPFSLAVGIASVKPCADTIIDNECPPCCPLEDCQEEFTTEDGVHVRSFWLVKCNNN